MEERKGMKERTGLGVRPWQEGRCCGLDPGKVSLTPQQPPLFRFKTTVRAGGDRGLPRNLSQRSDSQRFRFFL